MKNNKKEDRIIFLKLNKKELVFLNKLCCKKNANIPRSMIFNHFFFLFKNLSLDINSVKTKGALKKEILNALGKH
ncbi:MAG: hypothetical protein AB1498_09365 [bacterium]